MPFPGTAQPINHRRLLKLVLVLGVSLPFWVMTASAQIPEKPDKTVYTIVQQYPEFPGGHKAMVMYIKANTNYPSEARKAKITGRVFVTFTVDTDGSISDVYLLKGLGHNCDEEAIRVVKAMPCWLPGSQDGRPIRVKLNLPILFASDSTERRAD